MLNVRITLGVSLLMAVVLLGVDGAETPLRKTAIIVENRAGQQHNDKLPVLVAEADTVDFTIGCSLTDIKDQPITVPNVQLRSDFRVTRADGNLVVQPLDVTVELDGVAIGSAPGTFQARPGLHKLRLSREGFKVCERTINVHSGDDLRVAMQMSDAGYPRWKDDLSFLQGLEVDRKLTDAEVKRFEGIAKSFSESHCRVHST
jgi:hypothetical protein